MLRNYLLYLNKWYDALVKHPTTINNIENTEGYMKILFSQKTRVSQEKTHCFSGSLGYCTFKDDLIIHLAMVP